MSRLQRTARLILIASLVIMPVLVVFTLLSGEGISTETLFAVGIWAGWALYMLFRSDLLKPPPA